MGSAPAGKARPIPVSTRCLLSHPKGIHFEMGGSTPPSLWETCPSVLPWAYWGQAGGKPGALPCVPPPGPPHAPWNVALRFPPPQERGTQDQPHGSPGTEVPWDPGERVPCVVGGMFAPPSMLFSDPRLPLAPFSPTPGAPRPSPLRPPGPLPLVAPRSPKRPGQFSMRASGRGQPACTVQRTRGTQGARRSTGAVRVEAGCGRAGVRSDPGGPGPSPEPRSHRSSASRRLAAGDVSAAQWVTSSGAGLLPGTWPRCSLWCCPRTGGATSGRGQ